MIMWLAKKCFLEPESQETGLREKEMKLNLHKELLDKHVSKLIDVI